MEWMQSIDDKKIAAEKLKLIYLSIYNGVVINWGNNSLEEKLVDLIVERDEFVAR